MDLTVSALIATCGDDSWSDLAWTRAYPSVRDQGFDEVVVEHHPDATLAEARNRALASADCDYVVQVDADDELEPGYLDAMREAMSEQREWLPYNEGEAPQYADPLCLLVPAVRYVRDTSWEVAAGIPNAGRWPALNECVIGTAAPRRLLLEVGGFEEWRAWEDWAVFARCVATGARLEYVEDAVYRAHQSRSGRNQVRDGQHLRAEIVASHREWARREGFRPIL